MRRVTIEREGKKRRLTVPNVFDWDKVAFEICSSLKPGDVLALSGPLGAGKTSFVQALARSFGISRSLQSPTFALLRSYPLPKKVQGIQRLVHVDAYRLDDEREIDVLDLDEELADGRSIVVIEWAEKIPAWIQRHFSVVIFLAIEEVISVE